MRHAKTNESRPTHPIGSGKPPPKDRCKVLSKHLTKHCDAKNAANTETAFVFSKHKKRAANGYSQEPVLSSAFERA
jgi:hypothetical protein